MPTLADKSETEKHVKTEITPQRAEYIRSNMDKPLDELQNETGLSKYVIQIIKEARRNGFWRQRTGFVTKYERLTDEMKGYILTLEFDLWIELRKKFNHRFRMSDLTPMTQQTLKKYYYKLQAE